MCSKAIFRITCANLILKNKNSQTAILRGEVCARVHNFVCLITTWCTHNTWYYYNTSYIKFELNHRRDKVCAISENPFPLCTHGTFREYFHPPFFDIILTKNINSYFHNIYTMFFSTVLGGCRRYVWMHREEVRTMP